MDVAFVVLKMFFKNFCAAERCGGDNGNERGGEDEMEVEIPPIGEEGHPLEPPKKK